jgi:DNA-directed RNA polymerase beta subunit
MGRTKKLYIDRNFTGRNGDGYNFAKVRTRLLRKVCIGDKFASRSSQRYLHYFTGRRHAFTKDGVRPDIIEPSRYSVQNDYSPVEGNHTW